MVGDAFAEGQGEDSQGLVPALDGGSLDQVGNALSVLLRYSFLLDSLVGSLVFDVTDREPEQLDHRGVVGEVATVLDDLAQLVVQRLDRTSAIRLIGAVLAEQHDEWIEGRRYLGLDVLTRSQKTSTETTETNNESEAMTPPALTT